MNQETITKYQEQNTEITRNNVRLNERITILENVIRELQQDNLQLRIDSAVKQRNMKIVVPKPKLKKKSKPKMMTTGEKKKRNNIPKEPLQTEPSNKRRTCATKPISYILPSTKCKLRKGDPFTFGNEYT